MTVPRDFDEIVSALVDGELAADEAERVIADPEVARRVAEVNQARAQLRDLPPAPDLGRASAVAAAVGAVMPAAPPAPDITPGTGRRQQRNGPPSWLVAVAACLGVLGLVAGVALLRGNGEGNGDTFAASDESTDADTEAGAGDDAQDSGAARSEAEAPAPADDDTAAEADGFDSAEEGAAEPAPGGAEAPNGGDAGEDAEEGLDSMDAPLHLAWVDLGAVDNVGELEDQVIAVLRDDRPSTGDSGADSDPSCPAGRPGGDPAEGSAELSGIAELDGEPVWVQVYDRDDGRVRMVATDHSCRYVADRVISP